MDNIKQINTGVAEIIAVKVPDGANNFHVGNGVGDRPFLGYDHDSHRTFDIVELPEYGFTSWQILGIDTELTEEQCIEVVPTFVHTPFVNRYINYKSPFMSDLTTSAKESIDSLLQANGINEPSLILKAI